MISVVDTVVLHRGRVLLVRRGREPDAGKWATPGGRIEPNEVAAQAARREVEEETGVQLHALAWQLVGTMQGGDPSVGVTLYLVEVPDQAHPSLTALPLMPPRPEEITAVRWCPLHELRGIDLAFNCRSAIARALAHHVGC